MGIHRITDSNRENFKQEPAVYVKQQRRKDAPLQDPHLTQAQTRAVSREVEVPSCHAVSNETKLNSHISDSVQSRRGLRPIRVEISQKIETNFMTYIQ